MTAAAPAPGLGRAARAAGHRLLALGVVGSTMDEARSLFAFGDAGPLWITATSQTSGRGRHGRQWQSPAGNFAATLLLPAPLPQREQPQLGFLAGVALHEAVASLAPGLTDLALKWPNDLLLARAKLAGLLVEGLGGGRALAIGFGVNLAVAPPGLPYAATALAAHGHTVTPTMLLAALSHHFADRLSSLAAPAGLAAIRRAWQERALPPGTLLAVSLPSGRQQGRFAGIDEHGRLLLNTAAGRLAVDAGDVFPLDMAAPTPQV
jgi:BirA family biotin operon repressor/biotin-[acetyl-CoA-carboxylase] ligase